MLPTVSQPEPIRTTTNTVREKYLTDCPESSIPAVSEARYRGYNMIDALERGIRSFRFLSGRRKEEVVIGDAADATGAFISRSGPGEGLDCHSNKITL